MLAAKVAVSILCLLIALNVLSTARRLYRRQSWWLSAVSKPTGGGVLETLRTADIIVNPFECVIVSQIRALFQPVHAHSRLSAQVLGGALSAVVIALSWVLIQYSEGGFQGPHHEGPRPYMIWNWSIWIALPWWLIQFL